MARITYDYNDVDEGQKSYDGDEPKPGTYNAKVVKCDPETSQKSGNKMLHVVLEITDGEYAGWWGHTYLVQTEESLWKTKEFTDSLGLTTPGKKKGTWNTDDAVGKKCRVKLRREMYEGEARAKVRSVLAWKADEAADEEPEPAEPEPEDAAVADADVWTWDDLKDLDRDALKEVVKDEKLDPKELGLTKSMDDEEVRAKIAEALGVEVPDGDGDGAEEDPF